MFLPKCGLFENRTMAINTVVMTTNSYTTRRDSPFVAHHRLRIRWLR